MSRDPLRLISELKAAISRVNSAGTPIQGSRFSEPQYREKFALALNNLKSISSEVAISGHMQGIAVLSEIEPALKNLAASRNRDDVSNEAFWDVLTTAYPYKAGKFTRNMFVSDELEMRMLVQSISQEEDFGTIAKVEIAELPDHLSMRGIITAIKLVSPPIRDYSVYTYKLMHALSDTSLDSVNFQDNLKQFVEHKNLFIPLLNKIIKACDTPNALMMAPQFASGDDLSMIALENLGYSEAEAIDIIDRDEAGEIIPGKYGYKDMADSVMLSAQFLAGAYELTKDPVFVKLGEMSIDKPRGTSPYLHLEKIGVSRDASWHYAKQEEGNPETIINLYEHAINTPGIELCIAPVAAKSFFTRNKFHLDKIISLLEKVEVSDKERRRKGQALFDALMFNAISNPSSTEIHDKILASAIPLVFYGKYPELKGKMISNELGI